MHRRRQHQEHDFHDVHSDDEYQKDTPPKASATTTKQRRPRGAVGKCGICLLLAGLAFLGTSTLLFHHHSMSYIAAVDTAMMDIPTVFRQTFSSRRRRIQPAAPDILQDYELIHPTLNMTSDWKTMEGHHRLLCGEFARAAASRHATAFPKRTMLDQHSRVVITGLLSTTGMNLALGLAQQCGVQHILGVDDIMPNTKMHRVNQMERWAWLKRKIPELERISVPYVGLSPKNDEADDLVRIRQFQPTHIVHLLSSNKYYTENALYQIRNSLTSLDQLFRLTRTMTQRPNLAYLYDSTVEQLVATSNYGLFIVPSVGLKIPPVYGPWDQEGSPTYNISDSIVRNATIPDKEAALKAIHIESLLFVDNAVDLLISAMQFQYGPRFFDISSPETRRHSSNAAKRTEVVEWLGWTPSTSRKDAIIKLFTWHYSRVFPFGSAGKNKPPFLPQQRNVFPCASECAPKQSCRASVFDAVSKVSYQVTKGCKYLFYMTNFWPSTEELPQAPANSLSTNSTTCKIAFVSGNSPLVQNIGTSAVNGVSEAGNWTLVWIDGDATDLVEAEYMLPKLSPGRLFSNDVTRAVYFNPLLTPILKLDAVLMLLKIMDAPARRAKRRRRQVPAKPATRARTVVFFGQEQHLSGIQDGASVTQVANAMIERDGITPEPTPLAQQLHFYQQTGHLVETTERRYFEQQRSYNGAPPWFPFQWMQTIFLVHNMAEEQGRLLRCEWYDEQVFWGNSDLEDVSLAYVLGKRQLLEQHVVDPEKSDWFALVNRDGDKILSNRKTNTEVWIRILAQAVDFSFAPTPQQQALIEKRAAAAASADED